MLKTRKDLINLEMSMIMRKRDNRMSISYGMKTKEGFIYDGRFHMLKRPHISAILGHIFRNN